MAATEAPPAAAEAPPEPAVRPQAVPDEQTATRRQPPYAVVLHNDDLNTMAFVVGVLRKVFRYGYPKAVWLMLKAHFAGRCAVWAGSLEVAELKADQVRACGPDPATRHRGARPLTVSVEPLPG